jgi:predicted phage terminase large subunit-like protein
LEGATPEDLRAEEARLAKLFAATEGEPSPPPVKEIRKAAAQELRAEEERPAEPYVETDDEPLTHAAASENVEEGDSPTALEMEMGRQGGIILRTVYENPFIPKINKVINGRHVQFPSRKQARFLAYDGHEALFGGSAGAGKSRVLLAAALQYVEHPGYAALLLRRTFRHLMMDGGLIPMSHQWLDGKARWSGQTKSWTFPSGATLSFGYYDHDDNYMQYQGGAWDFIGWDELTQFKETWYRYLFSRLRRLEGSPIPGRIRAASNPGGPSHEFVKKRFVSANAKKYFVQAFLTDNPGLDKAAYYRTMAELDPITRAQLLQGDWNAYSGGRFKAEWFQGNDGNRGWWTRLDRDGNSYYCWTGAPPEGVPVGMTWTAITCDPAATAEEVNDPTAIGVFAVMPKGEILILEVVREWLAVQDIVPRIAGLCLEHQPIWVGIEDSGFQVTLINDAKQYPGIPTVTPLKPEGKSKLVRARPAIIRASNGDIFLPRDTNAFGWIEDFVAELVQFTGDEKMDAHDDQVDMLAYFVQQLDRSGMMPAAITPDAYQNNNSGLGSGRIFMG